MPLLQITIVKDALERKFRLILFTEEINPYNSVVSVLKLAQFYPTAGEIIDESF